MKNIHAFKLKNQSLEFSTKLVFVILFSSVAEILFLTAFIFGGAR